MSQSGSVQAGRLVSLDQFRGYCVLGMFVVNFLGSIDATPKILRHNNTHFSLADSIMPAFILIAGYSFRLTFLKRSSTSEQSALRRRFVWRSLGLICLSLMFFGFGNKIAHFDELTLSSVFKVAIIVLKADMWEVLAIIGACQLLLLPFIHWSMTSRLLLFGVFSATHLLISGWFNWDFVYGLPNGLDSLLGTTGKRAWDGGFFGLLSWSELMLLGSVLPDLVSELDSRGSRVLLLLKGGALLMLLGYLGSCLTRLYDKPIEPQTSVTNSAGSTGVEVSEANATINANSNSSTQAEQAQPSSKVWPPLNRIQGRSILSLLAEPPLVSPPPPTEREPNYWAMDKRIVSQTFVFFSAGWALALYGLFILACDTLGHQLSMFKTFGENPLAAYLIHHMVEKSLMAFFPKDSSFTWAVVGMLLSIWIAYRFVRFLEDRKLYLRL